MAGAEDRAGIWAQDGRNSHTISHGDQGGSWSCSSGWRGLLFVLGQFGLPHIFEEGVCVLVAISDLSSLKEEWLNYVSLWAHGAEHTRTRCRNFRLSLSLLGAVMGWGQWCQATKSIELGVQVGSSKGRRAQKWLCAPAFNLTLEVF